MLQDLADCVVFKGLTPDELGAITELVTTSRASAGEQIFGKGDSAEVLYLVRSGKVDLQCELEFYHAPVKITVDNSLPGDALGWSALIAPHEYTLSAIAAQDSDLWQLARADIQSACENNAHLGYVFMTNVARVVGQRLKIAQQMLVRELQAELQAKDPLA
jgi:CRP-like cAMP-binding protein